MKTSKDASYGGVLPCYVSISRIRDFSLHSKKRFTVHYSDHFFLEVSQEAYELKRKNKLNIKKLYKNYISPFSNVSRRKFQSLISAYIKEIENYFSKKSISSNKDVKTFNYGKHKVIVDVKYEAETREILNGKRQLKVLIKPLDLSKYQNIHFVGHANKQIKNPYIAESDMSLTVNSELIPIREPNATEADFQSSMVPNPEPSAMEADFQKSMVPDSTNQHTVLDADEMEIDKDTITLESALHVQANNTVICESTHNSKEIFVTDAQETHVVFKKNCCEIAETVTQDVCFKEVKVMLNPFEIKNYQSILCGGYSNVQTKEPEAAKSQMSVSDHGELLIPEKNASAIKVNIEQDIQPEYPLDALQPSVKLLTFDATNQHIALHPAKINFDSSYDLKKMTETVSLGSNDIFDKEGCEIPETLLQETFFILDEICNDKSDTISHSGSDHYK